MEKVSYDNGISAIASPFCIVGSVSKRNSAYTITLNCGVLSVGPPIVYIALKKGDKIAYSISEAGSFSVNIPSISSSAHLFRHRTERDDRSREAMDVGILSDIAAECPITLICGVNESFTVNGSEVIIGRVEKTFVRKEALREGQRNPHMGDIDPLICFSNTDVMNKGKFISDAFSIGHCYGGHPFGILRHVLKSRVKFFLLNCFSRYLSLRKTMAGKEQSEIERIAIRPRSLIYPLPAVLVGTCINEVPNYCVIANCGIISNDPPTIYISSNKSHFTNIGLKKNHSFSINIPNVSSHIKLDYCGIISGKTVNKSSVFSTFYGENTDIPFIQECPVNIECKVIEVREIGPMEVFIAEVAETYLDKACYGNGSVDIKKVNPIIYALNRKYFEIGKTLNA